MLYYIGLDNGGTTTKAALYTGKGEEVGVCSTETKTIIPKPGFAERDMEEMWQANCYVLKNLLKKTAVNPSQIAGIACCGHGKGLYLWGQNDKPIRNGIISTDNRAWEYPLKWEREGISSLVFALSCQKILACQPVSLLAWLKDNEPESLNKIKWIFECKDYVRFRLTGRACAEITDYSGANLLNLYTGNYDTKLLSLFGIEDMFDKLPPLCNSTDICGYITHEVAALTGLKEGTPVAGGMFDIDACAVAVNGANENNVCMIAGTWSINEYVRKEPVLDGSIMMNSLFCLPGFYLIEECSPTSAGNLEWIINTIFSDLKSIAEQHEQSIYEVINQWVESLPANEFCPVFLPFLMASNVHPKAKACFIGISNYHTRMHIARSVYEGIAFSHRYHFEKLLATRNKEIKNIRLAGGVIHSKIWTQIFADVLQYPVEIVNVNEAGTLGCAMATAVATGGYKDLEEAAKHMVKLENRVEPNPNHIDIYNKKYALYKQIASALDGVWDSIHELM
jgi:L-xylulokinase